MQMARGKLCGKSYGAAKSAYLSSQAVRTSRFTSPSKPNLPAKGVRMLNQKSPSTAYPRPASAPHSAGLII